MALGLAWLGDEPARRVSELDRLPEVVEPIGGIERGAVEPVVSIGAEAIDINSAPSVPTAPMDRARGVEDMVRQQAEQNEKRVMDATR